MNSNFQRTQVFLGVNLMLYTQQNCSQNCSVEYPKNCSQLIWKLADSLSMCHSFHYNVNAENVIDKKKLVFYAIFLFVLRLKIFFVGVREFPLNVIPTKNCDFCAIKTPQLISKENIFSSFCSTSLVFFAYCYPNKLELIQKLKFFS